MDFILRYREAARRQCEERGGAGGGERFEEADGRLLRAAREEGSERGDGGCTTAGKGGRRTAEEKEKGGNCRWREELEGTRETRQHRQRFYVGEIEMLGEGDGSRNLFRYLWPYDAPLC
jgi:hypothetical protein